jgi:hypothetical protein
MIDVYETPYKAVHINVAAPVITVRTSGGFDSAVVLYLVAKGCAEHNTNAIIQPITVVRTNDVNYQSWHRVDNLPIVDGIIDWVRSQFPTVTIRDKLWENAHHWWNNNNISYLKAQRRLVRDVAASLESVELGPDYMAKLIDYNGITKNPPVPMSDGSGGVPNRNIDSHMPAINEGSATVMFMNGDFALDIQTQRTITHIEPFRNADKRITIHLATELGIFDTLNDITRSCEGGREETDGWTKTCDICWWCLEKDWAIQHA